MIRGGTRQIEEEKRSEEEEKKGEGEERKNYRKRENEIEAQR